LNLEFSLSDMLCGLIVFVIVFAFSFRQKLAFCGNGKYLLYLMNEAEY